MSTSVISLNRWAGQDECIQLPLPECKSIAVHRCFLARAASNIVIGSHSQLLACLVLQQARVGCDIGPLAEQSTFAVDLGLE